jgi:hypothetical protein
MGTYTILYTAFSSLVCAIVVIMVVGQSSLYVASQGFGEEYTMDDLDRISLAYVVKSCLEKRSEADYIKVSVLDESRMENLDDLCGITKSSDVTIVDSFSQPQRSWEFSQGMTLSGKTHGIYVNIGDGTGDVWVGEMRVTV